MLSVISTHFETASCMSAILEFIHVFKFLQILQQHAFLHVLFPLACYSTLNKQQKFH